MGFALRSARQASVLRTVGAVLAFTTGFVHLILMPVHLSEGIGPGLVFALASGAILLTAVGLLARPRRNVYGFGIAATMSLIGLYAASRLIALPFTAGREPVEIVGVLTKAVELALLICLSVLWMRERGHRHAAIETALPAPADRRLTRRQMLRAGLSSAAGLATASAILTRGQSSVHAGPASQGAPGHRVTPAGSSPASQAGLANVHPMGFAVARQHEDAMDPMTFLTHFDYGKVSRLPNGQTLREYRLVAFPKEIAVAKDVSFPAWTFNGTVPGPTLRCTEGDRMRIVFHNGDKHHHTIHLHGIHPANMDGVFEQIPPNGSYTYDFVAEPFGLFPFHCHTMPVTKHIMKGLYGTLIVDSPGGRPPAKEMIMVMNGFDPDFDEENEFYTINGIASYYLEHPIKIRVGELVRIYLTNMTEFDQINSFHLHGNVFKLYRTGTRLDLYEITDTVILGQGERAILEFTYKYPGRYVFHAHINEFAERGWISAFDVLPA